MSNNIRINFKIDTNTKNLLQQKANELNTSMTEIIRDGIHRAIEEDNTLRQRMTIMVQNQELFERLFKKIRNGSLDEVEKIAEEIWKGEKAAWQI